jgi:hypothetical protein
MRHWLILALAALSAHADVTLRYRIDANAEVTLPAGLDDMAPAIQMKGAKGATKVGRLKVILDVARREITVIDEDRKTFATFPASDYGARLAAANGAASPEKAPELPKVDFRTRKTGRAEKLLDIDTEETEGTMAMQMGVVGITMSMRVWTPKPAEVLRVPALREATAASLWFDQILKLRDEFDLPGIDGLPLRMDMEVRLNSEQPLPGVDPSKPMFQVKILATELSTAALDDALFRVPEGFTAQPAEEVLKHANDQAVTAVSVDIGGGVQAFIPGLDPVEANHDYPEEAKGASGPVRLLVTIGPDGRVLNADPLTGPEPIRKFAVAQVMKYRYRPVLRDGKPVTAMTDTTVFLMPPGAYISVDGNPQGELAAAGRVRALEQQFPRTPQQVLADLEQDAGPDRKAFHATDLAQAALDAGDLAKAETYANLALFEKSDANDAWNRGNRIHKGHIVLGRVALRRDQLPQAREHLLAAGKTPGSPQLDSFGPDFTLARELLEKDDLTTVLAYLDECRAFWKLGAQRLDTWSQEIRSGKKPKF